MPDPKKLKVGDHIRFIALPEEWKDPKYGVPQESIDFMKTMISRSWPSRIAEFDAFGYPLIHARIRKRGRVYYHSWLITESTGWRKVRARG